MKNYFTIGKIVNTQGIKGEVRVLPTTDDINRFKNMKKITIYKKDQVLEFELENVRFHKQFVLLKLKGVDSMSDAEILKNFEIRVEDKDAIPCKENEYYIRDLYGMTVETCEGEVLGTLDDIIFTGANDVYVVKTNEKTILIPAIKQCIVNVNIEDKKMKVSLLEGLR